MKKQYFWGVLFGLLLIWGATVLSGTKLRVYVNIPSLFMVLGLSTIIMLFSWDLKSVASSFKAVFAQKSGVKELKVGIEFFSTLTKYFFLSAAIGTGTGLIAILTNLSDVERIGAVVALAMLSTYYSLILTLFITLPFRSGLRKKLIEMEQM